jgi:hypothetical protein
MVIFLYRWSSLYRGQAAYTQRASSCSLSILSLLIPKDFSPEKCPQPFESRYEMVEKAGRELAVFGATSVDRVGFFGSVEVKQ